MRRQWNKVQIIDCKTWWQIAKSSVTRCLVRIQRVRDLIHVCYLKGRTLQFLVVTMWVAFQFRKLWFFFFLVLAGSVFVDCGSTASYVDSVTNISWVPDAPEYITTGVNGDVPSAPSIYANFSEFTTVRYFPDTLAKNCYSFPVMSNSTYMIRGSFFYGYYDNGTTLPSFQMGIDGTIVANVSFDDATKFVYYEFIVVAVSNVTFLCLLRDSSNSVPFVLRYLFWFCRIISSPLFIVASCLVLKRNTSRQDTGWTLVETYSSGMS